MVDGDDVDDEDVLDADNPVTSDKHTHNPDCPVTST